MAEDNKNTQLENTENTNTNEENNSGKEKTFTQADLDSLAGKIRGEEKAKNEEAVKKAVAAALEEERRQAKLTEEEREKEKKKQHEQEMKAREDKITLRERRIEAQELLAEKEIPTTLVDFVVDLDADKTAKNVDTFAEVFNKAVEEGVKNKLKGETPTDPTDKKGAEKEKTFSSAF